MGVCVEVGVGNPGVRVHDAQAGESLRPLIAGVSSLTSLGQQTVGELQRQPAMMILFSDMTCLVKLKSMFQPSLKRKEEGFEMELILSLLRHRILPVCSEFHFIRKYLSNTNEFRII